MMSIYTKLRYRVALLVAMSGGVLGAVASAHAASVSTGTRALEVTRSAVTITGTINPEGQDTRYYFQYGQTSAYGQNAPSVQGEDAGKGAVAFTVAVRLTGLVPNTLYHYRLLAVNTGGVIVATGTDQTFTTGEPTPPTVAGENASNITLTTATLSALVDPVGLEADYVLEIGTDTTYGTSIAGEAGASSEETVIEVPIVELAPSTTYHYRFLAINPDGRVYGTDNTFTTPVYEHPIVLPNAEPLLSVPTIAFPAETVNTAKPKTKKSKTKNTKNKKHKKSKHRKK
jgi:phosphodiesterase/alkaline phosphatase D-like protein